MRLAEFQMWPPVVDLLRVGKRIDQFQWAVRLQNRDPNATGELRINCEQHIMTEVIMGKFKLAVPQK